MPGQTKSSSLVYPLKTGLTHGLAQSRCRSNSSRGSCVTGCFLSLRALHRSHCGPSTSISLSELLLFRVSNMDPQVKVLAVNPRDLSSIPGSHTVVGKNPFQQRETQLHACTITYHPSTMGKKVFLVPGKIIQSVCSPSTRAQCLPVRNIIQS